MPKCDFNKVALHSSGSPSWILFRQSCILLKDTIRAKLLCNFIEITLRYGCFPVNLLYIFGKPFLKNTSGRILLYLSS